MLEFEIQMFAELAHLYRINGNLSIGNIGKNTRRMYYIVIRDTWSQKVNR